MNALVSAPCERMVALQGACNFRDIGGYRTQQGRSVRWRRVYRAGVLSYFVADDHVRLHDLGVQAICDLRRVEEREREPTRWPKHVEYSAPAHLSWPDSDSIPTIRNFAAHRPRTGPGMFDAMVDLYRALPEWMGPRIRGMFECIAEDRLPLVVHCAAGKDRTGIAIAVLLRALDVPQDVVLDDYLLTNDAGDFEQFLRGHKDTQLGLAADNHPLLAMPDDMRAVLFSARTEFLEAAFEEIERRFGGLDAYLERTAGVSAAVRARVSATLLE
jgi:protein-tyrosine phosphatase